MPTAHPPISILPGTLLRLNRQVDQGQWSKAESRMLIILTLTHPSHDPIQRSKCGQSGNQENNHKSIGESIQTRVGLGSKSYWKLLPARQLQQLGLVESDFALLTLEPPFRICLEPGALAFGASAPPALLYKRMNPAIFPLQNYLSGR